MPAARKKASVSAKAPAAPRWTLHILSDATGNLASHILHSVITQFPGVKFTLRYHLFQNNRDELLKTLGGLKGSRHLVLHALLDPSFKELTHNLCHSKKIDDFDLTGSLVQFIADHTRTEPVNELSRLHNTGPGYFRRIRAMEFTAQHDDNRRLESIDESDIVIVGLSRVSKSPTSFFLGAKGYKVANVALAPETGFPRELDAVKDRIVAFTTRPRDLWEIRRRRFADFNEKIEQQKIDELPYYNLRDIIHEVSWAETEFRRRGYPMLNIHDRTVEETGSMVLTQLNLHHEDLFYPSDSPPTP